MNTADNTRGLIKGLSYAFPTSGAIRLGKVVTRTKQGKTIRLPCKDDEFTLTTKIKDGNGDWQRHPLDGQLRETHGEVVTEAGAESAARKLRKIPVTIVFDRPELNMGEQFAAFSSTGSPLCVGDGQSARRRQEDGSVATETCPGARHCKFGEVHRCDAFLRLLVRVQGQAETAPPFILRTGSVNAVTDNRATLEHWATMYGGRLAGLPFNFVLDAKQTALSHQSVFYFGRLEPAFASVAEGARILRDQRKDDADLGIDRRAAEQSLLDLRANGDFAEDGAGDGEQFDDLLAGRFSDELDGEQRSTTFIGAVQSAAPRQAGAAAVAQLAAMLNSKAATEAADQPA